MKVANRSVWLYLVVVLASASRVRAQSVLPPIFTSTAGSLDVGDDGVNNPTDKTETSDGVTAITNTEEAATDTVFTTKAPVYIALTDEPTASSSASESPAVTPTLSLSTSTTESPEHTFSSQPASTPPDGTPSVLASTQSLSLTTAFTQPTTGHSQRNAPGQAAEQIHQEIPSQLNVGDEDFKGAGYRSNSLDPLLAGLLSVFIVTTAVVFVVLFLKFRHQNSNPEFHRLQDLPMDDLMEDTPLSRYTY